MATIIENLRVITRHCLSGERLPEELSKWLGTSLDEFLAHRVRTIEEALGLRSARGGVPWWLEEAIRRRDAALRTLATAHFVGSTVSVKARRVRTLAVRYAASAWRFDREREAMPERYADTVSEYLWRAFKSGAPMPIGERHLRSILGGTGERGHGPLGTPASTASEDLEGEDCVVAT